MASLRKRGKKYYASYYVGGKEHRRALETTSHQVAKERLRHLEASLSRGTLESDLPTKTPMVDLLESYVRYIQTTKTKNSIKVDTWYLRAIFGPICPALQPTRQKAKNKKRRNKGSVSVRPIEVNYIEQITTAMIAEMIDTRVQRNGIAPKTANRYREIVMRLVSWATDQRGVRMPGGINPANRVERRKQSASEIRFLTLEQVDEQLTVLRENIRLQTTVAMYIYAGLRREELLWLADKDIDLNVGKFGVIRVQSKTINGTFWEPKTKKNRAVPISSTLRQYLDHYESNQTIGQWYFPSPKGTRWDPDNFYHYLKEANKKAGFVYLQRMWDTLLVTNTSLEDMSGLKSSGKTTNAPSKLSDSKLIALSVDVQNGSALIESPVICTAKSWHISSSVETTSTLYWLPSIYNPFNLPSRCIVPCRFRQITFFVI